MKKSDRKSTYQSDFRLRKKEIYKNNQWVIFPDDPLREKWDIILIMYIKYSIISKK